MLPLKKDTHLTSCAVFASGIDKEIEIQVIDSSPSRLCGCSHSKIKMKLLITAGFVLYTLGFICVGAPFPADVLREHLQWLLYCGLVLIGAGSTLTMIPTLPLLQLYQGSNASEESNDRLTSYWNGSFNLGAFIGPIIWSMVNQYAGFSTTYLSIAATTAAFAMVYKIIVAKKAIRKEEKGNGRSRRE
jgi:MFS family permease